MIRPNTIGSIGHLPVCQNVVIGTLPALNPWGPISKTFNSQRVINSEFTPGVNSFALMCDSTAILMPGVKQWAYHMPITIVPDKTRPGYPFIVTVVGRIHLECVATKAPCDCVPFVGYSNTDQGTADIHFASAVPCHVSVSDADTIFVDGVFDHTFTTAIPPIHESETGFHLVIGFLFRSRSGDVQFRVIDNNISSHVLYQNRPCYDPSIS